MRAAVVNVWIRTRGAVCRWRSGDAIRKCRTREYRDRDRDSETLHGAAGGSGRTTVNRAVMLERSVVYDARSATISTRNSLAFAPVST